MPFDCHVIVPVLCSPSILVYSTNLSKRFLLLIARGPLAPRLIPISINSFSLRISPLLLPTFPISSSLFRPCRFPSSTTSSPLSSLSSSGVPSRHTHASLTGIGLRRCLFSLTWMLGNHTDVESPHVSTITTRRFSAGVMSIKHPPI